MIGHTPIVEDMLVVDGQPFVHNFATTDAFPAATTVTLKIYDRTGKEQLGAWPAVQVDPSGVLVTISADELLPVPSSSVYRVWILYASTPLPVCWYQGRVRRQP